MRKLSLLYERILRETDDIAGKDLLVVDIQPEYKDGFDTWLPDFIDFINTNYENFNSVTFFYNGAETIGMIDDREYRYWLFENGLEENIVFDGANFYDKGYAFFRYCMDMGEDEEEIANLVKYMSHKGVNDSRDLDEEFWNGFVQAFGGESVRELLEFSDDCIHIPELMDELKRYNNIVICGGGEYECLKEVHIALDALDKPYQTLRNYVY